ncbi:hypothetical protein SETIT_7G071700v2 [Setaria italica]|uniref:Uncharacterized protein n=1 Tax=Setaria italica TaxID=4555 RepID=A0A368RT83_SETIT|nr:hypothetical protein SETIT_7G071700v2 [Setaria italica]
MANPFRSGVEAEMVNPASEKKKKKKTVRMTQEQIDSYLAFKKLEPLSPMKGPGRIIDTLSQETLGRLPKDIHDEDVRRQYQEKGYVEYEVTDDEEEDDAPAHASTPTASAAAFPANGRRRHRPGVARNSGVTNRLN